MFDFYKKYKLRKHLKQLAKAAKYRFSCDNDILSAEQLRQLAVIREEIRTTDRNDMAAISAVIEKNSERLDRLNPLQGYRRSLRNFLDVLAVAFGVAFGLRALYIQPFKIPTSSMQPTLFGIHYVDRKAVEENRNPLIRTLLPLFSQRAYLKVKENGELEREYSQRTEFLINDVSTIRIGDKNYDLPGTIHQVAQYLPIREDYKENEVLCDGYLVTGDHVFVERLSIHFREIKRGDVAVFNTENIVSPTQPMGGFYYIKRIVGLPGDTIRIRENILEIKPAGKNRFKPSTEFSDRFKVVDSFKGGYQGHRAEGLLEDGAELTVPENAYFALGDNTANSLDGRNWGFIPRRNMIGLAVSIFWPISRRWGIVDTLGPVTDKKTRLPESMFLQ